MFHNFKRLIQLHESISVIYVVDGYQATLEFNDGDYRIYSAQGESVEKALTALDTWCDWYVIVQHDSTKRYYTLRRSYFLNGPQNQSPIRGPFRRLHQALKHETWQGYKLNPPDWAASIPESEFTGYWMY